MAGIKPATFGQSNRGHVGRFFSLQPQTQDAYLLRFYTNILKQKNRENDEF